MSTIGAQWLPVLVSAVAVFFVSFVLHMLLPWHKSDFRALPNEEQAMQALRALSIPPGDYMVPRPSSPAGMRSPEFLELMKRGPVGVMTLWSGGSPSMGRNLAGWFAYAVLVSWLSGHIAHVALHDRPPDSGLIVHTVGLSAFLGYSGALWQQSIWYKRSWVTSLKSTIDGGIYAAITACIFCWLWPR
jgi:hypothetical protein